MAYIPMTEYETATPEVRARYDDQTRRFGRITNMKRTLLHNTKAFDIYMEWYTLADLCRDFIGGRALSLYSLAISQGNRCLVCSTYFRKILIDTGADPDTPDLDDEENTLIALGASIAEDPHNIDPQLYSELKARYTDEQIVLLIALGGMMVATNLFNTVAKVDLDDVLLGYKKAGPAE